jgi:hypothetical protein
MNSVSTLWVSSITPILNLWITRAGFAFLTIGRSDESQVFYDFSYFCDMVGSDLYRVLTIEQNA